MSLLQRSWLPIAAQDCCCCDLKTFCKVLGWVQVVGSTLAIFVDIRDSDFASATALFRNAATEDAKPSCVDVLAAILPGIILILRVVFLVAAIFFLMGISKGEPSKMVHYIRLARVEVEGLYLISGTSLVIPRILLEFFYYYVTAYSLHFVKSLHVRMMAGHKCTHRHLPTWLKLSACILAALVFSCRPSVGLMRVIFT